METLSNDYISKEAVIKTINHTAFRVDSIDDVIKLRERIKALPTINIPLNNSESVSKEEAIEIISNIDKAWRNFTKEEYIALEMALESLKAEEE